MIQVDARMEEMDLMDIIEQAVLKRYKKKIEVFEILKNKRPGFFDFFYVEDNAEDDSESTEYKGSGTLSVVLSKNKEGLISGRVADLMIDLY